MRESMSVGEDMDFRSQIISDLSSLKSQIISDFRFQISDLRYLRFEII